MINNYLFRVVVSGIALFFIIDINLNLTAGWDAAAAQQTKKHNGVENRSEDNSLNDLNPEIKARLEAERNAFFQQTAALRAEIYKKKLAMKDELQKDEPDGQKLKALNKEISRLKSLLNKERYKFLKKMQMIHPQAGTGYFERGIMGQD
ncbi:MAG: periplasmic heavy metal sensor [Planctomycetota bacterium]|jgi:predicted RNase H-like nuclease (RuvC/YqgF family)